MTISIDLGQKKLFAAVIGKDGTLADCFTMETGIDRGRIGNIAETASHLCAAIKEHNIKAKDCCFQLPLSSVLLKEMQVPKLKKSQLLQLIRTNFSSFTDAGEDYAVDYISMEDGDVRTVTGILVKKQFLTQCVSVARLAGLTCRHIDIHPNAILKYREQMDAPSDHPEILACIHETSAELLLTDNNTLFTRLVELESSSPQDNLLKSWAMSVNNSLLSGPGDESRKRTISEQLRSIAQFQLSRNGQRPVGRIYLYGETDGQLCSDIAEQLYMEVLPVTQDHEQLPYINAIGGIIPQKGSKTERTLNLLDCLKRRSEEQKKAMHLRSVIAAVLLTILVLEAFVGLSLYRTNHALQRSISECTAYMESDATKQALQKAEYTLALLEEQKEYNQTLSVFKSYLQNQFRLGSTQISNIYRQAADYQVNISYYEYRQETLLLRCNAPDSKVAAAFAKALQQNGYADKVSFTGYELEAGTYAPGYNFEVNAVPGKEAAE